MKYLFFLIVVFLLGCDESPAEKEKLAEEYEKCENERVFLDNRLSDIGEKFFNLQRFFGVFFEDLDFHKFALDDSLIVFDGFQSYYIYSVGKRQIWSGHCGALENLSQKYIKDIEGFLNQYINQLDSIKSRGETSLSLDIWTPKRPDELKIYKVDGENVFRMKIIEIEKYLIDNVFVHGCKRHVLTY